MHEVILETGERATAERATGDKGIDNRMIVERVRDVKAIGGSARSNPLVDQRPPERPTRIDVNIHAVLTTADGHSFKVVIRDLSAKGFRVALDDEVLVGEQVSLQVGSREAMRGEIKWALGREAGGHFLQEVPESDPGS